MYRKGEIAWLVGEDEMGRYEVVQARLVGEPVDGQQVVRVGLGCGILHSVPVEKVYKSQEEAEKRREELTRAIPLPGA